MANKVTDNGLRDDAMSWAFYEELNYRVQFLENTRRGFFCVICAIKGQKAIWTTWSVINFFYSRRVYYDKEFCNDIMAHTEPLTYFLYRDYSEYMKQVITMFSCVTKPNEQKGGKDNSNNQN